MATDSARARNVYLVGPDGITEIVNGRSNNYRPCREKPVIVRVSAGLRRREVADLLTDLIEHIGPSRNTKASRAKAARREKIYVDLS